MTQHKARTIKYRRPWLAEYQRDAIFCDARYAVIEATTKAGKTAGCLIWLLEQAMNGREGRNYWWVAPVYQQATMAYSRMKRGLPQDLYKPNDSDLKLTLRNGAVIWFKSAEKPDNLYGEDVFAAVIDEASRARQESWWALRSTLTATAGPVRLIGNVKGRKNWFYTLARRAEAGEPDMHHAVITAPDAVAAGILDQAEIDDAQRNLPEHVFRELYLAEPSDDGSNPFGLSAIDACVAPQSDADPHCFGWDLAKSVDWTVGIALDDNATTCYFERFQKPWKETTRKIIDDTGGRKALVDSTGVGDPILEQLQEAGENFEGYKFTQSSKQQLMEGLALAIQNGEIAFPDGPIVNELKAFEFEHSRTGVRYSAPEGMHDDCVMALALANQHRRKAGPDFFVI